MRVRVGIHASIVNSHRTRQSRSEAYAAIRLSSPCWADAPSAVNSHAKPAQLSRIVIAKTVRLVGSVEGQVDPVDAAVGHQQPFEFVGSGVVGDVADEDFHDSRFGSCTQTVARCRITAWGYSLPRKKELQS